MRCSTKKLGEFQRGAGVPNPIRDTEMSSMYRGKTINSNIIDAIITSRLRIRPENEDEDEGGGYQSITKKHKKTRNKKLTRN